jgi:hypothetical protein
LSRSEVLSEAKDLPLSRLAGVSEGTAERELAGEIPSAVEGPFVEPFAGVHGGQSRFCEIYKT